MSKREATLVLLILILGVTLSVLLLERSVTAQNTDTTRVLTADELRIVDKEGRTRIRLSVSDADSCIEIFDRHGDITWQAPPNDWLVGDNSGETEVYTDLGGSHWIQTVLEHGQIVILEDGSRWEVQPLNQNETVLWAPTSPITITEADSPVGDFQYVLTNTEEGQGVQVKYRGRR